MVTELRFPSPGLKFYVQGGLLGLFGIVLMVLGVIIVAVDPWNFLGAVSMAGGIVFAVAGLVIFLLVWFLYVYGTITIWRDWRQLRPPEVTIDIAGARYHAPRRPTLVPWPDVEQVIVRRTLLAKVNVTKVYLRLASDAALLRADSGVKVPASRELTVGPVSDPDVTEEEAVRFLHELAGARMELTEVDRRPPVRR